jgi:hypothetical protein
VKQYAENKFIRILVFKSIQRGKRILQKCTRKVQWKMIIEYLKVPKILDVFFWYISLYFSAYFVSPQKYLAYYFVLYYSLVCHRCTTGGKAKLIVSFLTLETLNPNLLVFSFLIWEWVWSNLLKQLLNTNGWSYSFVVFWVLEFWFQLQQFTFKENNHQNNTNCINTHETNCRTNRIRLIIKLIWY